MFALMQLVSLGSPNDTANTKRLARDTFVEFVATTLFIFAGTLSATSTGLKLVGMGVESDVARTLPIAMTFGISIMVLAFSIGHMTGGHMNPAVSLLMLLRRQISPVKMICYWLAQFLGSLVAASLTWGCISNLAGSAKIGDEDFNRPPFTLGSTTLDSSLSTGNGFLLEFMGSVFFYFVIAQTALDKRGIATSNLPAIPIGFSLIVVHICLIPFTGCGVNPARTFGPSMVTCMGGGVCEDVAGSWYWIYYIGPFLAAWFVAELTVLMEMDVGEPDDAGEEAIPLSECAKDSPEMDAMKKTEEIAIAEQKNVDLPSVEVGV